MQNEDVPTPQPKAFFAWLREHIDAGHPPIITVFVNGGSQAEYDHIGERCIHAAPYC